MKYSLRTINDSIFDKYNVSSNISDNIIKEIYDTLNKHCLTVDDVELIFEDDRIYLKALNKKHKDLLEKIND